MEEGEEGEIAGHGMFSAVLRSAEHSRQLIISGRRRGECRVFSIPQTKTIVFGFCVDNKFTLKRQWASLE